MAFSCMSLVGLVILVRRRRASWIYVATRPI